MNLEAFHKITASGLDVIAFVSINCENDRLKVKKDLVGGKVLDERAEILVFSFVQTKTELALLPFSKEYSIKSY